MSERLNELLDRVVSQRGSIAQALSASEWHELQDEASEAVTELATLRKVNASLLDELSQHFAVAITARALCADEALMGDLRDIIDSIGNGTPEQRIASLPERLRAEVRK